MHRHLIRKYFCICDRCGRAMMEFCWQFLIIALLFRRSDGSSNNHDRPSCKETITKLYDIPPSSCISEFVLTSSTPSYAMGEPIRVTISSQSASRTFIGFLLTAEDDQGVPVGSWNTSDSQVKSVSCGGILQNSDVEKKSVEATWYLSTAPVGNVHLKAILIESHTRLYLDCYHLQLTSRDTVVKTSKPAFESSTKATQNTPTPVPSPTADVALNVSWAFHPVINVTVVRMAVTNLKSAQWAAIGLGMSRAMGRAHVFMCKRRADDTIGIDRYINPRGHEYPESAGSDAGGVLTPGPQKFHEGLVICEFNLSNFNTAAMQNLQSIDPLSQSAQYYPLFAVGSLDSDNEPQKHHKDSCAAQHEQVQLDENEIILYKLSNSNRSDTKKFVRVHGVLMTCTWIFLVSIGLLVSRYFRTIETNQLICGTAAWFAVHRLVMSLVTILTVVAFLFILVSLQGTWVEPGWTQSFAHSVLGAIAMGLAFFQPFIALFRCESHSPYRFVFKYLHGLVGIASFFLSMAVLFLATYFHLFSNTGARLIVIVWIVWIGFICLVFEVVERCFRRQRTGSRYVPINPSTSESTEALTTSFIRLGDPKQTRVEQRLKLILLLVHVSVAGLLSVLLSILIVSSE